VSGDFGRHRLIHSVEFLTPEFQELDNDHRVVWLYCKAGPQSTSVGIYRFSTALAVEDLGNLTAEEFDARLLVVCDCYRWQLDAVTRVLWIPDWLEKNPPQSPNVVTSWIKLLSNVPDCALKIDAVAAIGEYLKGMKPSFLEPFNAYRLRLSKESRRAQPQPKPQADSHQGSGIRRSGIQGNREQARFARDAAKKDERTNGNIPTPNAKPYPSETNDERKARELQEITRAEARYRGGTA
jgi:hypothetical protein